MKTRTIVLVIILGCGAAAILFAVAAYLYIRRRRKKREDEEDGTSCAIRTDQSSSDGGREKNTSRLNGFLNLKTPLISTKTLGISSLSVDFNNEAGRDQHFYTAIKSYRCLYSAPVLTLTALQRGLDVLISFSFTGEIRPKWR